jgi:hypothetical protein
VRAKRDAAYAADEESYDPYDEVGEKKASAVVAPPPAPEGWVDDADLDYISDLGDDDAPKIFDE